MKVSLRIMWVLCILSLIVLWAASPSWGVVESFNGPAAGTVVAGNKPGGGTAPGTTFPDFTVSVVNSNGPQSCIIFDSAHPTGMDWDLGTPNQDFGGPGIGKGGCAGEPGSNNLSLGNLLIIAEDLGDADLDGIVDDPDDDKDGGTISFTFHAPTELLSITLVDIDEQFIDMTVALGREVDIHIDGTPAADNSIQKVDLSILGLVTDIRVNLAGSGAVGEIEYRIPTTATEEASWGGVKELFR